MHTVWDVESRNQNRASLIVEACRFWKMRERIKDNSPHGRRPGWSVTPIIVKSGDDCRQELLAAQLIEAFHDIFQVRYPLEAGAAKLWAHKLDAVHSHRLAE